MLMSKMNISVLDMLLCCDRCGVCVQCLQCKLLLDLHRAMQGQVAANSPLSTCTGEYPGYTLLLS